MATVRVDDVPDAVLARLRARADETHQSLQDFIKKLFDREADLLTMAEASERAEAIASGSGVTTEMILQLIEEDRARHE
jgi:thymidine kinase